MKQFRRMAAALCAVFLLCGFVIPAYAYADGGEGADYGDPTMTEETTTPEPESTPRAGAHGGAGRRLRAGGQSCDPRPAL